MTIMISNSADLARLADGPSVIRKGMKLALLMSHSDVWEVFHGSAVELGRIPAAQFDFRSRACLQRRGARRRRYSLSATPQRMRQSDPLPKGVPGPRRGKQRGHRFGLRI